MPLVKPSEHYHMIVSVIRMIALSTIQSVSVVHRELSLVFNHQMRDTLHQEEAPLSIIGTMTQSLENVENSNIKDMEEMPTTSRQRIIVNPIVNKPVTVVSHSTVTVPPESNKSQSTVKETTTDATIQTISVPLWELFNSAVQPTCSSVPVTEESHQKSTTQPEDFQPNTSTSEFQMDPETLRPDSIMIRERVGVFSSRISDKEETSTTSFLKIIARSSAPESFALPENHSKTHREKETWNALQLDPVPTPVHQPIPVNPLPDPQPSEECVVHVRSTCANCQENKETVEHTRTDGGSMPRLETVRNSFIPDVKEMQTTLKHTKNARITVEMPEVNHNVSKEQLSLIPMETSSFVEDPLLLPPLVQPITTVIMMEPPMDVVQLKLTLVPCPTNLEHPADQLSRDGTTIPPQEPARPILSMDATEIRITSQHNKTVRITVELSHVQMEEKYGRNRMEQREHAQPTDSVHQLITVLQ